MENNREKRLQHGVSCLEAISGKIWNLVSEKELPTSKIYFELGKLSQELRTTIKIVEDIVHNTDREKEISSQD